MIDYFIIHNKVKKNATKYEKIKIIQSNHSQISPFPPITVHHLYSLVLDVYTRQYASDEGVGGGCDRVVNESL